MNRQYGPLGVYPVECINPLKRKYRVRWDFQPFSIDGNLNLVDFVEIEILHKPTISEIKDIILSWHNKNTEDSILSGFTWKDMPVWLSSENQFNYKAAYDLAFQTNGASLPTVFKFGDTENPIYYKFDTLEELQDFYIKAMRYINEQLAIGWAKKDAIDWSKYEEALNV